MGQTRRSQQEEYQEAENYDNKLSNQNHNTIQSQNVESALVTTDVTMFDPPHSEGQKNECNNDNRKRATTPSNDCDCNNNNNNNNNKRARKEHFLKFANDDDVDDNSNHNIDEDTVLLDATTKKLTTGSEDVIANDHQRQDSATMASMTSCGNSTNISNDPVSEAAAPAATTTTTTTAKTTTTEGQNIITTTHEKAKISIDDNDKSKENVESSTDISVNIPVAATRAGGILASKLARKTGKKWYNMYTTLLKYNQVHGHCNVSHNCDKELYHWVKNQEYDYQLLQRRESQRLNPTRLHLLNTIGFSWFAKGESKMRLDKFTTTEEEEKKSTAAKEDGISTTSTKIFKAGKRWLCMYKNLQKYHGLHGHCMVTHADDNELFRWVKNQRYGYQLLQRGKTSPMNPKRLRLLNEIGFSWRLHRSSKNLIDKETTTADNEKISENTSGICESTTAAGKTGIEWLNMYKKIQKYHKAHGHCNVNRHDDKELYSWVSSQRHGYKLLQRGEPSRMNPKRLQLLNEIGFPWRAIRSKKNLLEKETDNKSRAKYTSGTCKSTKAAKTGTLWLHMYTKLQKYHEAHGHCNVNHNDEKELYNWVSNQRYGYRLLQRGEPSRMNPKRLQLLNEIGFSWRVHGSKKNLAEKKTITEEKKSTAAKKESISTSTTSSTAGKWWLCMYKNLQKYYEIHGHCMVSHDEDNVLSTWVFDQRSAYQLLQRGEKSRMNPERLQLLNEIGFSWNVHG